MKRQQKTDKMDVLQLLRLLRREYDSDDPASLVLTKAITEIESLRMQVEDLQSSLEGLEAQLQGDQ